MLKQSIIQGCINNQAIAQKQLYDEYCPRMLAICYRYAQNREDAEDMLQEGFLKIFMHIKNFEFRGSFEGWIHRIMVHTCINMLKKNRKFGDSVELDLAQHVEGSKDVFSLLQAKEVIESIRLLPIGYRTVLNLYAIEGFNHAEIATALEIEESTSRSQYTRAKSMLLEILYNKKIMFKKNKTNHIITSSM